MMPLPPLSVELRTLIELAGISVFLPVHRPNGSARAGAHTSVRSGTRTLSAFYVQYGAEQEHEGSRLEVVTLPRNRILGCTNDHRASDRSAVEAYLEREACRELAMRSLELREGAAERLDTPLGELILMRERQLPAPSPIAILVDGEEQRACTISFGAHAATWSDLPTHGVAAIVYERDWPASRELVTFELAR